jgi:hypothetical protein
MMFDRTGKDRGRPLTGYITQVEAGRETVAVQLDRRRNEREGGVRHRLPEDILERTKLNLHDTHRIGRRRQVST